MQNIQDNEFDRLFKDKFAEAEITPPLNLWDKIDTQLSVKPKRAFPVYWMAAALAIAAVSLALLFPIQEQDHKVSLAATTATAPVINALPEVAASEAAKQKEIPLQIVSKPKTLKKDLVSLQPLALNPQPYGNDITVKQERLGLPMSVSSAADTLVLASINDIKQPVDQVIGENETRTENKGIRNMGDLINYVVDKVDKSDEKIIQFKTEDDNSSLVALNIGIIRFNTKKHK